MRNLKKMLVCCLALTAAVSMTGCWRLRDLENRPSGSSLSVKVRQEVRELRKIMNRSATPYQKFRAVVDRLKTEPPGRPSPLDRAWRR